MPEVNLPKLSKMSGSASDDGAFVMLQLIASNKDEITVALEDEELTKAVGFMIGFGEFFIVALWDILDVLCAFVGPVEKADKVHLSSPLLERGIPHLGRAIYTLTTFTGTSLTPLTH